MNRGWRTRAAWSAFALVVSSGFAIASDCPSAVGPDIITGDVVGAANFNSVGDVEVVSFGTVSCNVGDAEVHVVAMTNQHYLVGQNLYRYREEPGGWSRFEQLGQSWLRHGFFALSGTLCCSNCTPTNGTAVGVGCSDPLSAGGNSTQSGLGPRWQVDANTGAFPYPPASPPFSGSAARRLQVPIADLEPTSSSTTRYFAEAHYLAPDDATAQNGDNNASYREVSVTGLDTAWTFGLLGSTQRERSAIRAWRDVDPTVQEKNVDLPGEGHLMLAFQVTDLGGGTWHYEYALYNMNSHDSVRSLSVPVPVGVVLTNVGFHDVAYHSGDGIGSVDQDGTDWAVDTGGDAITWSTATFAENANANALRWGTTYNFRFDANSAPQTADIGLVAFRTDAAHVVLGAQGPSPLDEPGVAYCTDTDGASALCPCGNAGLPGHGCDNAHGTGGVRLQVTSFAPNGLGGGTATIVATSFPSSSMPTAIVIRSAGHESPPAPFGDGLRCISSSGLVRFGSTFAAGGQSTHLVNHGAGPGTFSYQVWYRSMPMSFCDPAAGFNLSNGYDLTW